MTDRQYRECEDLDNQEEMIVHANLEDWDTDCGKVIVFPSEYRNEYGQFIFPYNSERDDGLVTVFEL